MKKILCILLSLLLVLPLAVSAAEGTGEPCGDSDGVIPHEKLAGLYRWLCSLEVKFFTQLTFDEISEAVGKAGHDRQNGDGKTHGAEWCDEEGKYFVVVTFKYREETGKWTATSVSTGIDSAEYRVADTSSFPHIGNRDAGASPTAPAELEIPVKGTDAKAVVTADVPTEFWYTGNLWNRANYYNYFEEKNAGNSGSSVVVYLAADASAFDEDLEGAEVLQALDPVTVDGAELQGNLYVKDNKVWTEYSGQIADGAAAIRIVVTEMIPLPGTEAAALIESLKIALP